MPATYSSDMSSQEPTSDPSATSGEKEIAVDDPKQVDPVKGTTADGTPVENPSG
ncbi:hypothetical protein ACFDTO_04500 [Microbacteriaceae bacterium 4G12]